MDRQRALAVLCGAGALAAAVLLLLWGFRSAGMLPASGRNITLPEAEKLEAVQLTCGEWDITVKDNAFIAQLLQHLSQAKSTGKASVRDVPDQGVRLVRIDFIFKQGGASTAFLYRDGDLLVEQPYQGIYRLDDALESWLRDQVVKKWRGLF